METLQIQLFGGRGRRSGLGVGGLPLDYGYDNNKRQIKTNVSEHMKRFRKLNDVKFSKVIQKANKTHLPEHLNSDSLLQKVVHIENLNDKPTILNEKEFNSYVKESKTIICYRGIRPNGDLSAEEIRDITKYADYTYIGNGIHGDGIYFTTLESEAEGYGECIMTIAIKRDAKIINKKEALELYNEEKRNHTLVGESLRNINYPPGRMLGRKYKNASVVALQKGYDIIKVEGGNRGDGTTEYTGDFYIVLNRAAIVIKE